MGHRKSHLLFSFFIKKVLILTSTSTSRVLLVYHVVWVIAFVAGSELIEFRGDIGSQSWPNIGDSYGIKGGAHT